MASSSTTGRRSISSPVSLNLLCDCGADYVLKTSHTKENPGRKFWGCPYYPDEGYCKFFEWDDHVRAVIDTDATEVRRRLIRVLREFDGERKKSTTAQCQLAAKEKTLRYCSIGLVVSWIVIIWLFILVTMG